MLNKICLSRDLVKLLVYSKLYKLANPALVNIETKIIIITLFDLK